MTSPAPENIPVEPKSPARSRTESLNTSSSVGNLRFINDELRSHVTKLRNQLEAEKGNLKQAHRQKVLDIKNVRELEQKKTLATIIELKKKFHEEKIKEIESLRETISQKLELEKNKCLKVKDTEMTKLRQELDVKEKMLNKLLSQTNQKTNNDQINVKLLDELSELRSTKRQLEESLSQATVIEKHHSENLKKLCSSYESELVRVRREAHMEIRHMIEELKTKEKHIAQLEQDLGHQSGYMMQLEKKISSQDKGPNPSSPGGATTPSKPTSTAHNYSPSKDSDGNQQTNLKENSSCQNSKNKVPGYLARKSDKENSTFLAQIRSLQQKISEQYKTINALRQACSEKDRRIELIQHRKMKKRLRRSLEKCASTNGDDDACSVDSEVSVSSLPMDNGTDENQLDIWDEYAREEIERSYRQLMREHLELKKSYTLLQAQTSSALDPERELKLCRTLESDLFEAQCKIEELKALLQTDGLEPRLLEEKETLQSANIEMQKKLKKMEDNEGKLQEDLSEAREQIEDLEFRILELEESQNTGVEDCNDALEDFLEFGKTHQLNCDEESKKSVGVKRSLFREERRGGDGEPASIISSESGEDEQLLREEVNSLRKQIIELTERPVMDFPPKPSEIKTEAGHPTETKDGKKLQESKKRIEELEKIAIELQGKIIGLQQDKVQLEEQLSQKSYSNLKLDKIKALEEADMRNSRKLVELQEDENHLRESLRNKDDLSDQSEMLKTLKKKIKDLEKSNKLLKSRVVELEDSECEVREHWNQIVETDANKIEGLQEKVKMLESLNRELEKKLQEGEEEFMTGVSLASELSFSQNPPDSKESTVSFDLETEYKNLEEKFQEVTEAKNSKIAELEDHLEKLYSTEQKLSETVAEMEERERELLAKLKLCENSDFSVEKMLKYEERIKELSYSQENLLNAIDTVADPESHSLQIINALKDELVLSYQKNEEMSLREKKSTEQLRNENNSLKDQLDKLLEKESGHLGQILSTEKGKDALHNEHSLVSQNSKQEVPTSSLFVRIQELETENQELRIKVDGSQNGTLSKVSSTVSSNYERLCELEKENSDLLAEASRLREAESQWKEMAEKLVQLESNEERLMEKVVELEDSCESLKEELQKVHGDKKESQNELKEEREKVGSLLKLEAEIKGRLQAEEELNGSLREQLQSFRLRLEAIKDAYADHEHSKMELEKKLEEVTRDKNLLAEKLQSLTQNQTIPVDSTDPNQNSADHDILEHSSLSSSDSNHSSANTSSLPFHSTENKYLGLINSLEASLKDIGSNQASSEFQNNKQGPIAEQASKSKEELSKELESELADMNREQLVDFCSTLKTDLRTKSQKIEQFERDFSDFVNRVQCGTVVFRDKEVRKTVLTEVKTFQQQCNCKVPINTQTTLAGEKVSQGVDTADLLIDNVTEQQQQQQQQQKDANDSTMAHVEMPHSEYKVWKAKVAILTNIEANLPNVKESPHQLELLLQILQKGRDIMCSDENQAGISNDQLLIYAKQLQTLSQGLNSTTSPDGTGTDAGKEVSQVKTEQLGAGKEAKGLCSKTPCLFNKASKSDRKKVIKELINSLSSEDLVVVAQILKQRLDKGKVKKRAPKDQLNPSMSNEQKEFEEIEVDMWLSSEDEDGNKQPSTEVEQVQAGTDSVSNAAAAALPCTASNTATAADETKTSTEDDEWKPPLPKTPPPDQPPTLLEEPEVIFVDNNDVTDKHLIEAESTLPSAAAATVSQQQHMPQTANTNDQSKQQVNILTKALNDKNKYITMLEASIERLGQMLSQPQGSNPDAGVREEAIKKLESQLKSLQQELRQHHVEGQQSLTSLRTQLQGNTDITNTQKRQSFPQCHPQKPTPLAHSYSTTDLSRISFSASDVENLLKMPYPVRAWPSCSHLAPQTFSRTVRRRSDTFDPKLLPAGQQQQQQQQHQLLLQSNHGNIPVSTLPGWSPDKTSLHHLQQQQPKSQMLAPNSIFVAASDYSPELFSASGHLHLEIPLKEGDVIIKKGPVGANGYCEALVKGKVGLVPYKYLHPVKLETMTAEEQRALHLQFRGDTTETNTEHIRPPSEVASYFQKAHLTSIPNLTGNQYLPPEHGRWNNSVSSTPPHTAVSAATTTSPTSQFVKRHSGGGGGGGHISHTPIKGLPEAPSTFRLERIVGDNSVLLSWLPPMMDELDQNNGMQLIGYRIFLNGRLCQQPGSAHLAKAVVENLDLSRPQYFAIQSVAANGQMSPSAEVVFEGLERWLDDGDKSTESDTDLSEILPSPLGNSGPQRTFVAIYDYNPSVQSPHDYAESELRFNAGDLITVFGNQRSDGFFWAELNGNQGLVPASFVEEVPTKGSRSKPVSRQNSNASQKSLQNTVGRTSR